MSSTRADRFSASVSSEIFCLRIERREVLEEDLLARPFGRLEVDRFDLDQREVALAVLRRANLARHGVAGVQVELADLRRRHVDVVGARQVVVVRRPQEPEPVGQHLEHAFREDEPALFGARLQDLEDQLLLAHAGRAGHVELLGDLRERADAHVLERRQIDALYFFGGRAAVALGRRLGRLLLRRFRLSGCCGCSPACLISVHSSSSPSPVTAETGSTGCSKTDSSCLSARIRSPRASLSILVATTALASTVLQPCPGLKSLSRPGCLAVHQQQGAYLGWRRQAEGGGLTAGGVPPPVPPPPACRLRPKKARVSSSNSRAASSPAASVTITGEIHEVERPAASSRDAIDVREPGLAGCRAGARDLLPDQRVDQARLPDIRTPHERDFRQAVAGEIGRACGARDEGGFDLQRDCRSRLQTADSTRAIQSEIRNLQSAIASSG